MTVAKKGKSYVKLVYIMLSAILPLLICSKSSPLYPLNDWYDINIFMTLGKGMVHGNVLYVDLFDHKGPYVYLVAAISYLISNTTFLGFFIFECISLFFFLYYITKIMELYSSKIYYWMLPLVCVAITMSKSFFHGGSIEELFLGIFAYAIYSLLVFLKEPAPKAMSQQTVFVNGLLAGVILWSKFNLLGIYIAWMLVLLSIYIVRKQYKEVLKSIAFFMMAILLTTIPWLFYFGYNDALYDWFKIYIWDNVFGYGTDEKHSLWMKIIVAFKNAGKMLLDKGNWCYSVLIIFGCISYLFLPARHVAMREKISTVFMGVCMVLGIYIGGITHDYYGVPIYVFVFCGVVVISILLSKIKRNNMWMLVLSGFMLAVCIGIGYFMSPNTYLMGMQKEKMPQYRFAKQIELAEDESILNYGFLDGGFYTVLNQVPNVRMFCVTNMSTLESLITQNEYVEEQLTNWVVTWNEMQLTEEELNQKPVVSQYYELVDYQYYYMEDGLRTYALYRKKI